MAKVLTALGIENLKPGEKRREVADAKVSGLYFIIQPSGARSWATRFRIDGRSRKFTLGSYPQIDLAEARRLAKAALGDASRRIDPGEQKRAQRAEAKAAAAAVDDLVENVVEAYVERYVKKRLRDAYECERLLKKNVTPAWKGRRLGDIHRRDVIRLLDGIVARGSPIAANRVLAQFKTMCSWAMQRGIIERSPAEGVGRPSPETPRERTLSEDELRLVYLAAGELPHPYGPIVRLLALTGQRRDEVAGLRWDELDVDAAVWNLPAARSKNRRPHSVPLSAAALEILQGLPRFAGSPFVFTAGKSAPRQFSHTKIRLDAAIVALNGGEPIAPFVLHDLRRSFVSGLARLGVDLHIIERAVNHLSGSFGGIVQVYQKHKYEDAVRRAMNAWAAHIEGLVTGKPAMTTNVVELAAARQ